MWKKKTPLKQSELKKSESWPKNTQGREEKKKKTNHADSEDILIYQKTPPPEKVTKFKNLGRTTHLKTLQKKKSVPGPEQPGAEKQGNAAR